LVLCKSKSEFQGQSTKIIGSYFEAHPGHLRNRCAAVGGVIAYRALFLEPSAAVVITNTEIRELPNYTRVVGGIVLLIAGAAIAFFTAIRKK
jgi:hypothetical protein